jgi:hypothetical protein
LDGVKELEGRVMEAREAYEGLLAWYDELQSEDTQHAPPISAQVQWIE